MIIDSAFRHWVPGGLGLIGAIGLSCLEPGHRSDLVDEKGSVTSRAAISPSGGLRALAAGLKWIAVYQAWQNRDESGLRRELEWVVHLNPQTELFWLGGARMLGFDVAAWRRSTTPDPGTHGLINREQLDQAVQLLGRAAEFHPRRSVFLIEEAIFHLRLTRDLRSAEQALARAQVYDDAPDFVPQIRAELLVKLGEDNAALKILETELLRRGPEDPAAMNAVIRSRINELRLRESGIDPIIL